MNIWSRITNNIFQRAHTRRVEATVPYPEGFRGALLHETGLCTACGTCAYVCSPSAIEIDRSSPQHAAWNYQLLKCTFCGRCVEYCPTHALSFETHLPKPVLELQHTAHVIAYVPCARCGELIIPLPHAVLEETYGSPVPAEIEQSNRLCERCRTRASGANIKRGFTGA